MTYHARNVLLEKGEELGFQLAGQHPCLVRSVQAWRTQRMAHLKCGDEILEVNFVNVSRFPAKDVYELIMQKIPHGKVILVVRTLHFQNLLNGTGFSVENNSFGRFGSMRRLPQRSMGKVIGNRRDSLNIQISTSDSALLPGRLDLNSVDIYQSALRNVKASVYYGYVCYLFSETLKSDGVIPILADETFSRYSSYAAKSNSTSLIIIVITTDGVSFYDLLGKKIITYPLYNVVFHKTFVDENTDCFCIVNRIFTKQQSKEGRFYELHMLRINKSLSNHDTHQKLSHLFNIPCSDQPELCNRFPQSSSEVIRHLRKVLLDRNLLKQHNFIEKTSSPTEASEMNETCVQKKSKVFLDNANEQHLEQKPLKENPVKEWGDSFDNLVNDIIGMEYFTEFLKKEFSEENIQFWKACNHFKTFNFQCQAQMVESARSIYTTFLSRDAPSLVNVNQSVVENLEKYLDEPKRSMFDQPQEQVFQLMKFDSYKRFLKSDKYKELLEQEKNKIAWKDYNVKDRNQFNIFSKDKQFVKSNALDDCFDAQKPQLWDGLHGKNKFLRVIFPDGTSTIISAEEGSTLKDCLGDLCRSKKILLSSYDVTVGCPRKVVGLDEEVSCLKENVIFFEKRTLFRFELPNGRSVGIKSNLTKSCFQVLEPIMKKNGFDINEYSFHFFGEKSSIPLDSKVSVADGKRLQARKIYKKTEKEVPEGTVNKTFDSRASLRRFRSSSLNRDERNQQVTRTIGNEVKQMFTSKGKQAEKDAFALMEALQRSNDDRFDDQRGLLPADLKLPEFLKGPPDKGNQISVDKEESTG
ncbi:regulator of G-protein signaling 14-like isoform X1 [Clytia hemisphaerica]|uniref:regulator of G-protein signaling 14-like isoform X1 n=1 Tax=Clytia hemisphaerica TaxID=252671 RepID=UPI0034D5B2DC|eukprot:TCONS_00014486-protein